MDYLCYVCVIFSFSLTRVRLLLSFFFLRAFDYKCLSGFLFPHIVTPPLAPPPYEAEGCCNSSAEKLSLLVQDAKNLDKKLRTSIRTCYITDIASCMYPPLPKRHMIGVHRLGPLRRITKELEGACELENFQGKQH